ncbi:MAG: preprotein translocase subunit SecA, partial [Bacteroidota bacterium]
LRAKTDAFKARIREAVQGIEEEQREIEQRLRSATATDGPVGGDGQAAEVETLSFRDRQALYRDLEDLDAEWLDTVEDILEDILPEAFAVAKETCRRMVGQSWTAGGSEIEWNMIPYDVQLIGGITLHRGNAAEMKTGEGKTLVAVAPIYLNALVGRGVHVVTVNPYLAQRDSEWMAPIFEFHGLTVACIDKHQPHSAGRKEAYQSDITYGTNNEFGFDYLRDNSFVVDPAQLVQQHHHFAIIDEVDSVLIDEARTPLIISGPVPQADVDQYVQLRPAVGHLVEQQKRLVAKFVAEGQRLLKEMELAEAGGDKKKTAELRDQAGIALLRADRGFPKNKQLTKLKQEPGVEALIQKTLFFYLQDSGKQMYIVDDELYYAVDEKQHGLEMTDKGRALVAKQAGEDISFFIIPDMGDEIAQIERGFKEQKEKLYATIREEGGKAEGLSQEEADARVMEELRDMAMETDRQKQELYSRYSNRSERIHAVNQLLRAYTLYEKDIEYIVQDNKVQIVDTHTGRVLSGRRYSDGLHQAIEAKENVTVQAATQTYATITLQNYFRMYAKLAGMTGTAETEAEEFSKIYGLDVTVIPTNKPIARDDRDDLIFRTKRAKYKAVIDRIQELNENGQPVLVGTTSVDVSEALSRMLTRNKIAHNVLNAKADRASLESEIVAQAGQPGAVTIATNMAGRGTDIKLGPGVLDAGGLAILGTERHESRRIDLQLRGRAGRQGDPGESQFYISLEDDLMRIFGEDRTARIMDKMGMKEDEVITHPWITKAVERAQKKVEQNNFAIRKRQLDYDDVLNAQRSVIYDRRQNALRGARLSGDLQDMLRTFIENLISQHFGDGDFDEIREALLRHLAFDLQVDRELAFKLGEDGLIDRATEDAWQHYQRKRRVLAEPFHKSAQNMVSGKDGKPIEPTQKLYVDFSDGRRVLRATVQVQDVLDSEGQEINDGLERASVLSVIDSKWVDHLRDLDEVKEGVGLRAYGQKDPLVEYKMEAYRLFEELIGEINEEVLGLVFKAGPLVQQQGARAPQQAPRARLDRNRARTRHDSAEADYRIKGGRSSNGGGNGSAAERDPSVTDNAPVVVAKEPGRNDHVLVLDPSTGEQHTMKYKHALPKIQNQGWQLLGQS